MFSRSLARLSREPGKGMRIHAPPVRDFQSQERGWDWLTRWQDELAEFKESAKKLRKKVPYDGTCPEIQAIRMEKKEWYRAKRKAEREGGES